LNPGGDWTTQAEDPNVLEAQIVALEAQILEQKAVAGDREAQFSLGCLLVAKAQAGADDAGAVGRPPKAQEGLALCNSPPLTRPRCVDGHVTIK
jgi:hypothetical protein